ncbi:lipoprotein [Arthrobacter sp. RIT-PI-e]|uniref:DUF58 domain-containing protein n=1 Tax=Arthrobacter sp. RIT-PI-e TaxID=1681197 RepID=UPI0006763124|nr:DUF58 domain-containing protein [Arthrobacter sp. RIT-PI-e]KNC20088.1 lipoprotein [Arthrobacter sp. RIT-PI-e]
MVITGRLVLLALLGVVPIILYPGAQAVLLWSGLLPAVTALDLALAAPPRRVGPTRTPPGGARPGEARTRVLVPRDTTPRTLRGAAREAWQPSAGARDPEQLPTGPAGGAPRPRGPPRPARRGRLHVETVPNRRTRPLGVAARQVTVPAPGSLRVRPPFNSKRHLPSRLRRLRELAGQSAGNIRGAGTEFDSLRDYVRGDDVRSIDWRATARRRDTVVRTWRPERDRHVVVVLDTSRTSAARIEDEPRLDTGIEAALLLAVLAERGGDKVHFLAFDRRPRARVDSTAKGNLLTSLVTALAPPAPELIEADWSRLPAQVRATSAHRSLVVLLTSLDSGAVEEGLLPTLPALTERHVVVVASVRDPRLEELRADRTTAAATFRAAAAERALLDRAAVAAQLRALGAEVVDAVPADLPPLLADTYIRPKAAGRL